DEPEVLEAVTRVVDAGDGERAPAEHDPLADVLARVVAREQHAARAADDDEPPVRELARVEAEEERAALDEQLDPRGRRNGRVARDRSRERRRQLGAREVADVLLEEPEVGAADV